MRKLFPLFALLPLASCACKRNGNLEGSWTLTHVNNEPVNLLHTQAVPTITFADGSISDTTAQPPMNATYVRDSDGSARSIAMPDLTGFNIPTMPDDLEAKYRIALERADTARVIDGKLYFWDGDEEVLRFGHTNSTRTLSN